MRDFLRRNFWFLFSFAAIGATYFAYRNLPGDYLYNDDFRWMSQARYQMTPGNLLTFQVIGFFRPLMNVIFFVTERVMPGNLHAYYATNFGLHLFCGLLVFQLVERLMRNSVVAGGTTLFFLLTSTHYSAVGWISARTTLVSTLLLLWSLVVVVDRPRAWWRQAAAATLYALALAAKEDAVVGVLLLALIAWFRRPRGEALPDRVTIGAFTVVTIAYLVVRTAVMHHLAQPNWGPGPHVLRNLAGGLLYQLYPWSLASLLHVGRNIAVPTHALWPEVIAIPVVALLVAAGIALRRGREVAFAIAWILIALLPVAPFRIRFFHTDWLTHDRYYYLSSIGACLCIVTVLDGVWEMARGRPRVRVAVITAAVVIVCGELSAIKDCDERFRQIKKSYQSLEGL
ncbi:MAG TPA: hypothetical protein VFH33_07755, partial [Candidatus Krumholzibacteria bacterium]|nr:hypothetical protein [Candidatus Krumholzibacteria bacterium]